MGLPGHLTEMAVHLDSLGSGVGDVPDPFLLFQGNPWARRAPDEAVSAIFFLLACSAITLSKHSPGFARRKPQPRTPPRLQHQGNAEISSKNGINH